MVIAKKGGVSLSQEEQTTIKEIMEIWYGKEGEWDRIVTGPKAITKNWMAGGPDFDKMLTEKYKEDLDQLQAGNREHW